MSAERPLYIEQLRAEARGVPYRPAKRKNPAGQPPDPDACKYLFTVCTGNRWMDLGQRQPVAKMLFGEFWHQGELCILFADTNTGKSVLAVQLGDAIAAARAVGKFSRQAAAANVLYIDFELSTTQFYQRYSHPQGNYVFAEKFCRAEFNEANHNYGNFIPGDCSEDDFLIAGLEQKINLVNATVLIIDNISCLRGGTENAAVAIRLMKNLKSLKAQYKLSILVLAHTPKRRNPARPIGTDDLHGSKLLINFADSAFAIGRSNTDNNLCYLKQIKQRNTRQVYGDDNVCLCRIEKHLNFLQFRFEGSGPERPHLLNRSAANRAMLSQKVNELSTGGISQRQISAQLGVALGTVNRLVKK
jgi:archaellum biogenesis ATPase FlaH